MKNKSDDDDPPIGPPTYTTIRIKQVRSVIGTRRTHREVLKGLGLRRIRHEVERPDTPAVRGMIAKVGYLLEITEKGALEKPPPSRKGRSAQSKRSSGRKP